ncbi:MAG: ferrous iron transport protein B [Ignavibacteria bacterium]|nr:ferrous iron transport protein B [Ignavibacteria bacterium]
MYSRLDKKKTPLVTLVGPPNSGKTTLYNYLSGKKSKTVNYPGSTVNYSVSKILSKHEVNADILDSPGIISLIASSPDEKISVDTLYKHPKYGHPDIVIVTVDASQLSRHLYLVKQMMESNFNLIVVVTMIDILKRNGKDIDIIRLSAILGCCVVKFDGRNADGIKHLLEKTRDKIVAIQKEEIILPVAKFDIDRDKLLLSYKQIEEIEEEVIIDNNSRKNGHLDISSINDNLVVLNNRRPFVKPDARTLKLDKIFLHKYWGLAIFFIAMSVVFTAIFWIAQPFMDWINLGFENLSGFTGELLGENLFSDLVSGGLIPGLGSVLVFLPQILILFFILELLEDSGYLARGAMLVDKPLSKIGLNGRSFVPMLSGFACAIPATMAARTIANKKERFLTIFILPLMSCSARIPVYALLVAFLTPKDKPYLGGIFFTLIYLFSIVSSLIIAAIANKFRDRIVKEKENSSFIIELPAYRKPKVWINTKHAYKNAIQYVKKAGPVILILSLVLWVLTTFPNFDPSIPDADKLSVEEVSSAKNSERLAGSYAAMMGRFIEPVMKPMGMDWRIGVSLVATFAAREVFVSSLALIFKVTDDDEDTHNSLLTAMKEAKFEDTGQKLFTPSTIIGLVVFFVFAMQCLSTTAIARKETGGWKIPILQIVVFTALAYAFTVVVVNGLKAVGVS